MQHFAPLIIAFNVTPANAHAAKPDRTKAKPLLMMTGVVSAGA